MADPNLAEDVAAYNERSLRTLSRAIALSQGRFSLILARCNYGGVQRDVLEKLQAQSVVEIRELLLSESTKTLYQAIKETIEKQNLLTSDSDPFALMVSDLERVDNLEHLLTATNQVRDEFRKSFPFPLVLWVNDQVLQKLVRLAPDFNSWAGVPIQFAIATSTLINELRQKADQLFDNVFDAGSNQFLSNDQVFGFRYRSELDAALQDLQSREAHLEPVLEACRQFVFGRDNYAQDCIEEALEHYQQSLTFWQEGHILKRQGVVLFHMGLCYFRQADFNRLESHRYLLRAKEVFEQCLDVFEEAQRPDWVARFIGKLGEVLRRLEAWEELKVLAKKSLNLQKATGNQVQLAQNYGFLAEVALRGDMWQFNSAKKANRLANIALKTLEKASQTQPQHRILYLWLLAQSQKALGQPQAAILNLERARAVGNPLYDPQLHIDILADLRSLYFERGQYREAFEIKREQFSVEHQYGFRAFIGAGRLRPQLRTANPALSQKLQQANIAPEIIASGRQQDVDNLLGRIARNDYKLTVLYGQSGVGKSSLITAGLIPALQQKTISARDILPVVVRVYGDWLGELRRRLTEAFAETRGFNPAISVDSAESIIEQLKKNQGRNLITILIFDQFEEFFHFNAFNQTQRKKFYVFLRDCLDISFVKVIISIREDHLSYLLECNRFTSLEAINNNILDKNIIYPLNNFSLENTKSVISSLTERSQFHLEAALVELLLQDLAGEADEVRPIELQIVGNQLQTEKITTLAQYHQLGSQAKLIEGFLQEVIKDCGPQNERVARLVLYMLIDEKNTRPLKTRAELANSLSNQDLKIEAEQLDFVLEILVRSGLLLFWSFPTECYQLVHDYLVSFIQREKGAEFGKKLKRTEAQLERVRKWRRRTVALAGTTSILATMALGFAWRASYQRKLTEFQKQRAEITELKSKSEALFLRNDQLGALIASIRAGKKFQETQENFPQQLDKTELEILTADNLQQTLSRVQEYNRLEGHSDGALDVSFSPNAEMIATASDDKTVKLWSREGKKLLTLTGHKERVNSVSFSRDGEMIATASDDKTVKLWSRQGEELLTLKGHKGNVNSVSFSPDGEIIATASEDNTVKLWSLGGTLLKTLIGHQDQVWSVSFSPDSQIIASASWDQTVKLWSRDGRELKTLRGHTEKVYDASFSPYGQFIATASEDKTVKLWQKDGSLKSTLTGHSRPVYSVSFSPKPGDEMIASASADKTVKIWNYQGRELKTLKGHRNLVYSVSFSPAGETIASASTDGTVKLWKSESALQNTLRGHEQQVTNVSFNPKKEMIASASADKTVKLWQRDGTLLKTLESHSDTVWGVTFSPDGETLASASADQTVKLWSTDGQELMTLKGHSDTVWGVAFSPVGEAIASASADKTVKLWSRDGQELMTLKGHTQSVNWVSFSPDGKTIATASNDSTVKLWSRDGTEINTFTEHSDKVWSVNFSPDGQMIASASGDNTVKLSKPKGTLLYTKESYTGPVFSVSFSPDGKTLASASDDHTVILWNWDLEPNDLKDLLKRSCNWLGDYLQNNLKKSANPGKSNRPPCN
ncbi:MAG: hypothetical protein WA919_21500 [Coleofasciculaceae cyanobacterium]